MPSSPSGSPLPLRFPSCAKEEQRGRQRAGNETLPPQRFIIPGILSARAGGAGAAPGTPGCGGMGTAGGSPCTGSGDSPQSPPRAGVTHRTMTSVYHQGSSDPHPVLTMMLARGGLVLGSLWVYLIPFIYFFAVLSWKKKGGMSLIHEFIPGSCGARERHCH